MYIHTQNHAHGYTAPAHHAGACSACASFVTIVDAIIMASIIILPIILLAVRLLVQSS